MKLSASEIRKMSDGDLRDTRIRLRREIATTRMDVALKRGGDVSGGRKLRRFLARVLTVASERAS
ncbi:MAG: 50S ribosomal protein L29 [Pseudomonadota bacterium]|nr:50S ribosomal protein L29 [Pseudomonadota bacterium]